MRITNVLGALLALVAIGCVPTDGNPVPYDPPAFTLMALKDQKPVALADFKGKVLVLDFFQTWCGPCRQLKPKLDGLYEKYKPQGLEMMSVTPEEPDVVQKEMGNDTGIPIYIDKNQTANVAYKVQSIPRVVVIAKNGQVIYDDVGPEIGAIESKVRSALGL